MILCTGSVSRQSHAHTSDASGSPSPCFHAHIGTSHLKKADEKKNCENIFMLTGGVFFTYAIIRKWKHLPINSLHVTAVYTDAVFDTCQPMRRPKYISWSHPMKRLSKNMTKSLTLISTCQVLHCQADYLFCLHFVTATYSTLYYGHVMVRCPSRHLPTKLAELIRSNHLMES